MRAFPKSESPPTGSAAIDAGIVAPGDGAFMEPRGCNRRQSLANRLLLKTAKTSEIRCMVRRVDGSSPSEGFRKSPTDEAVAQSL
jgi:hypothetical protein